MRYVGGKGAIARDIVRVIRERSTGDVVYEPFMGGGGITAELCRVFPRVESSDVHEDLVLMWDAVTRGWLPPRTLSEPLYNTLKTSSPSPLRGFAGYGCSFGGKWFAGYARGGKNADGTPQDHAAQSSRSVQKVAPLIRDTLQVVRRGYDETPIIPGAVIYCDPPYRATMGYGVLFDHDKFWAWAESASTVCDVYVSEYDAPDGWVPIWSKAKRQSVARPEQGRNIRTENLFVWGGAKGGVT